MANELEPQEPYEPPAKSQYFLATESKDSVWRGIGLALLMHLIQVPLGFLTAGISLIFLGVSQLVYIIPAIVVYKRDDKSGIVKGLIIVAAITFLLNATCTVLFFASLGNMH